MYSNVNFRRGGIRMLLSGNARFQKVLLMVFTDIARIYKIPYNLRSYLFRVDRNLTFFEKKPDRFVFRRILNRGNRKKLWIAV